MAVKNTTVKRNWLAFYFLAQSLRTKTIRTNKPVIPMPIKNCTETRKWFVYFSLPNMILKALIAWIILLPLDPKDKV